MADSHVTVTGKVSYKWHDTYDFHNGKCVLIPGMGRIPDDAMRKLLKGYAKEYLMKSGWRQTIYANFSINACHHVSEIDWKWGSAF